MLDQRASRRQERHLGMFVWYRITLMILDLIFMGSITSQTGVSLFRRRKPPITSERWQAALLTATTEAGKRRSEAEDAVIRHRHHVSDPEVVHEVDQALGDMRAVAHHIRHASTELARRAEQLSRVSFRSRERDEAVDGAFHAILNVLRSLVDLAGVGGGRRRRQRLSELKQSAIEAAGEAEELLLHCDRTVEMVGQQYTKGLENRFRSSTDKVIIGLLDRASIRTIPMNEDRTVAMLSREMTEAVDRLYEASKVLHDGLRLIDPEADVLTPENETTLLQHAVDSALRVERVLEVLSRDSRYASLLCCPRLRAEALMALDGGSFVRLVNWMSAAILNDGDRVPVTLIERAVLCDLDGEEFVVYVPPSYGDIPELLEQALVAAQRIVASAIEDEERLPAALERASLMIAAAIDFMQPSRNGNGRLAWSIAYLIANGLQMTEQQLTELHQLLESGRHFALAVPRPSVKGQVIEAGVRTILAAHWHEFADPSVPRRISWDWMRSESIAILDSVLGQEQVCYQYEDLLHMDDAVQSGLAFATMFEFASRHGYLEACTRVNEKDGVAEIDAVALARLAAKDNKVAELLESARTSRRVAAEVMIRELESPTMELSGCAALAVGAHADELTRLVAGDRSGGAMIRPTNDGVEFVSQDCTFHHKETILQRTIADTIASPMANARSDRNLLYRRAASLGLTLDLVARPDGLDRPDVSIGDLATSERSAVSNPDGEIADTVKKGSSRHATRFRSRRFRPSRRPLRLVTVAAPVQRASAPSVLATDHLTVEQSAHVDPVVASSPEPPAAVEIDYPASGTAPRGVSLT